MLWKIRRQTPERNCLPPQQSVYKITHWVQLVNESIMTARLSTKPINTSIILVYSSTNEVDKEIQLEFYEMLQAEIEKILQKDIIIIMRNFNAKVWHNRNFERIMENMEVEFERI